MKNISRRNLLIQSLAAAGVAAGGRDVLASSAQRKLRVAIIGCGRLGQLYAEVFRALPDTELVAIAEWNPERREVVGERFGVKALFRDAEALLSKVVPDLVAIVTPSKFIKDAVVACAEAGVKGVLTDRPFAARLSDADEMIETCKSRGTVLAGGALERANWEVEAAGRKLATGEFGKRVGASVHSYRGEICSGGTARMLVLQHFTQAEVDEVIAWGSPAEKLADSATDEGLSINARCHLTSGLECQVFGSQSQPPHFGVEVWTENALVRWDRHGDPLTQIFHGVDARGARKEIEPDYDPWSWAKVGREMEPLLTSLGMKGSERYYVLAPVTGLVDAVTKGIPPRITGETQRHALEIAIACKRSAQLGNIPVKLPLEDRSAALYPRPYRWLGGDAAGRPQSAAEAAGKNG
jgi:hypothetical protein